MTYTVGFRPGHYLRSATPESDSWLQTAAVQGHAEAAGECKGVCFAFRISAVAAADAGELSDTGHMMPLLLLVLLAFLQAPFMSFLE